MTATLPSTENLVTTAAAIKDKTLRANAMQLAEEMGNVVEGLGDVEKIWYPTRLKLIQQSTILTDLTNGDDAKIGGWVIGNTYVGTELPAHVIRTWNSRTLMDEDIEKHNVICQSTDGKNGTRHGNCRTCVFSKFVEGKITACRSNAVYIMVSADLRNVLQYEFYRTSTEAGKALNKRLVARGNDFWKMEVVFKSKPNEKKKNVRNPAVEYPEHKDKPEDVVAFLNAVREYYAGRRKYELDRHNEYVAERSARGFEAPAHEEVTRISANAERAAETGADADLHAPDLTL